jgi:hypothetical protein
MAAYLKKMPMIKNKENFDILKNHFTVKLIFYIANYDK